MRNIALIGKARSGKDTAANHLVRTRAYTRLAFADPLKEMALSVDPLIGYDLRELGGPQTVRLTTLVEHVGWERAKDEYPEVRRILQRMGQTQREFDENYWVNAMRPKLNSAEAWNMPVVVTDVRYRNEALMLRARGFRLVRLVRPLTHMAPAALATHSSETELDTFAADRDIHNSGSLDTLYAMIESVL